MYVRFFHSVEMVEAVWQDRLGFKSTGPHFNLETQVELYNLLESLFCHLAKDENNTCITGLNEEYVCTYLLFILHDQEARMSTPNFQTYFYFSNWNVALALVKTSKLS